MENITPYSALRFLEQKLAQLGEEVVPGGESRTSQALDVLWAFIAGETE